MTNRVLLENKIHPTAIVDPSVIIGSGNVIGPNVVIMGRCVIADGNWIGAGAVIGTPAEGRTYSLDPETGEGVYIGNRNVIRELTTVQQGTHRRTHVSDECYVMARSHVSHDVILCNGVTLSTSVQLGGHTWVGQGANLGLGAVTHQWRCIGAYAMVGMQAAVTRDVLPAALVMGVPAVQKGINEVGLSRAGASSDDIEQVKWLYEQGASSQYVSEFLREHLAAFSHAQAMQGT